MISAHARTLARSCSLDHCRVITDTDDWEGARPGTMSTTLRLTIPILLAGLSGLWAERGACWCIGI